MDENKKDYKRQIAELLEPYVDGSNVFIKSDWDETLKVKPGPYQSKPTTDWLDLMEQVTGIIAKSKYGLDTYKNTVAIVDVEQMLDLYATVGLPDSYDHWSRGKNRATMGAQQRAGMMGLAYEIVINSDPAISFCMTTNTKTMMALVIAHAAQGHNAFFKNNYLFKKHTDAEDIVASVDRFKLFVSECEEKYGIDRVERILDACHTLQNYAVDHQPRPLTSKTRKERELNKAAIELAKERSYDDVLERTKLRGPDEKKPIVDDAHKLQVINEPNILRYIADEFPHLELWERRIMYMSCDLMQYFYPQMLTKVGNEGLATYTHYKILHDMHDMNLISDGMMLEFMASHNNVIYQPDAADPRYSGINPYALGFKMLRDIERICTEPTEEDRKWFPKIAGQSDYMAVIREAAFENSDETLIYQYLSPKLMRDFSLIAIRDDDQEDELEVTAIADDEGYRALRSALASKYDRSNMVPDIRVFAYDEEGDRTLMLKHTAHKRKPLDPKSAGEVLKHIFGLLKHPVVLASFDEDDKVKDNSVLMCPPHLPIARPGPLYHFIHPEP